MMIANFFNNAVVDNGFLLENKWDVKYCRNENCPQVNVEFALFQKKFRCQNCGGVSETFIK